MTKSEFDLDMAAFCASLCEDVYNSEPKQGKLLKAGNAEVSVRVGLDSVIFAFRGTQVTSGWSWADILDNIRMKLVPTGLNNLIRLHSGYQSYFRHLEPAIQKVIKENPDKRIIFTGHSLGGAVASVAGFFIGCFAVYTFGAPKSGDAAFKRFWKRSNSSLFRVVHALDIAPKHPRELFGYRHAGELWRISRGGKVKKSRPRLIDFLPFPVGMGILDHRVHEYSSKLRRAQL